MKKLKKLLCCLCLVPCLMVTTACNNEKKISTDEYAKLVQASAIKFYSEYFYPNNNDFSRSISPLTVTTKSTAYYEDQDVAEYEITNGEGTQSFSTFFTKKTKIETDSTVSIQKAYTDFDNSTNAIVSMKTLTKTTEIGERVNETEDGFEDYNDVIIREVNTLYFFSLEGENEVVKIYQDSSVKTNDDEAVVTKEVYTPADYIESTEILNDFLEDLDDLFTSIYNLDVETIIMIGEAYKDKDTFGAKIDYSVHDIEADSQALIHMSGDVVFKNNLIHSYKTSMSTNEATPNGTYNSSTNVEVNVKYSADAITTVPEGYTATTDAIELEFDEFGF